MPSGVYERHVNSDGNYAYLMGSLLKQKVLSLVPHSNEIFDSYGDDLVCACVFCLISTSLIGVF